MIQATEANGEATIPSPSGSSRTEGGGEDDDRSGGSSPMGDYQYNADVKMGIEELCPVCGDKVSGYHYGLQTCESCKGFFKRTVQNKKVYSCVDNRNCLIDKTQRKRCPYCRFQKCLSVGMKLEAVRADRMRGGRNKFGPMYKRDRALKQQVVRQRQQMLAQMTYQMQINSMNNPGMGGGMPPSPNMGVMPNMDGMGPDAGPPDIKPNVAMLNMPPPHASNGGSHGPMGPTNMIGPPPHPMQHMLPMNSPENPSTSAPSGASAHSSHQGHYLPPQSYPSGIPTMNAISSMPMPMPSHMPAPPSHHHHHPYHHHHHHQHQPPLGGPGPPNLMPLNPVLPPPHTQSPPNQPAIPPLFRDLQKNEPDEREIQEKFNSVMEMLLQQQQTLLVSQQQDMNDSMMAQPSEHALQDLPRSTLQLLIKLCDQALFLLVEWARGGHFFRDFKVEDQMKLLQNCWSELLILDFIYKQTNHHKFDELLLMSGHSVSTGVLSKIGLGDVQGRLDDLVKKFRDLKLDHNEFVCLKFLILLNPDAPGVMNRQLVEHSQEKVNSALLEYCSSFYPNIQDKFGQLLVRLPEIRLISLHAEDYLYFRHLNGDIPENTLLMEMLHSKRK